jgi:thymidylate synthase
MDPGPLTVISHQLGIDPRSPRYEIGRAVAAAWTRDEDRDASGRHELRQDPNGYFVVTIDPATGEIVADHRIGGLPIKQYRGRRAATIAREIAADMAISLVSHALWVGQELQAHEALLAR